MNWGRLFVDAVFRSGDKHSNHGDPVEKMILHIVTKIRKNYRSDVPIIIRMDSGLSVEKRKPLNLGTIKKADIDGVISIGSYAACAAFIRDARDAGLTQPIANLSFVGSESLLDLLNAISKGNGKDYTKDLINSQVVPSYEENSLPAVKEYKKLVRQYPLKSPIDESDNTLRPFEPSFVSFEGFLNAKVLVQILIRRSGSIDRRGLKETVETIRNLDIGIGSAVTFGPDKHQGLDKIYYTTVKNGRFVPIESWKIWGK